MIDDDYEDWAYENRRQRMIDAEWLNAEEAMTTELSVKQDEQLKELEHESDYPVAGSQP